MDRPPEAPRAFDWKKGYSQLEQALESGGQRSPEQVARILEQRARALARPRQATALPAGALELLAFSIGSERFAIDAACVVDVLLFLPPTRVPCTPPAFLGVVNHRGRILPVLDLRKLFEPGDAGAIAWRYIVTVEVGGIYFGIAADSTAGSIRVGTEEMAPPPVVPRSGAPLILGVTAETIAVLDAEALARDPRIRVNEEVR